MSPQDILTYCKLSQIVDGRNDAAVDFWVPGEMTESGKTRLFDRRGPSVEILQTGTRTEEENELPIILVRGRADEVAREVRIRLAKDQRARAAWTEKVSQTVEPAAEIKAVAHD